MIPEDLDAAIDDVLARPEFAWRSPREEALDEQGGSILGDFFEHIAEALGKALRAIWKWIDKIMEWLFDRLSLDAPAPDATDWQLRAQFLLLAALAATLSVLAIFLLRAWKRRRMQATAARPLHPLPDITDEDVVADQLPSDQWMEMARDFMARGEMRLAVRAMFLSTLAHLASREHLTIAKHKSNREYSAELERRAHDHPDILTAFRCNVLLFERVWYGLYRPTESALASFRENQQVILGRVIGD